MARSLIEENIEMNFRQSIIQKIGIWMPSEPILGGSSVLEKTS